MEVLEIYEESINSEKGTEKEQLGHETLIFGSLCTPQVHNRSAPLVAAAVRQAPLLRTLVLFFLLQRPCSLARVCIVYFVIEV